jgi:lipopolysaccharide exporter
MWLLAGTALLQSAESVKLLDLHRALRFDRVMRYAVAGKVASFLIVVPLAFIMRNYWPLLLSGLFSRLLVTIPYSYILAPYRPRLALGAWRELFHFSKWLALGNVGSILDGQLMNFVLGRFAGLAAVGLFQVIYQVAALPISEIAAPIRQPIYAGFSRIYHDTALLRLQFLKGLEMQCVVILPLSLGVAATAPDIVTLFLGTKWQAAAALLPAVALYALFDALGQYTHHLFIVLNRQRSYTLTFYASLAVRLPLTVWAASTHGIAGAILAMLATSALNMGVWAFQARPMLALGWHEVLARVWRASAALLPLVAGAMLAGRALAMQPVALRFGAEVAGGGLCYAAALLLLWRLAGAPEDASEAHLLRLLGGLGARLPVHRRIA